MALVLVCGLPGAGKTYLCERAVKCINQCTFYSFDNFVKSNEKQDILSGRETRVAWQRYIESIINSLTTQKAFLILVEDNFYLASMRRPFKRICNRTNVTYRQIIFDIPIDVCLVRNSMRIRQIDPNTIKTMNAKSDLMTDLTTLKDMSIFAIIKQDTILDHVINEMKNITAYTGKNNVIKCKKELNDEREQLLRQSVNILVKDGHDIKKLLLIKRKMAKCGVWTDSLKEMRCQVDL